MRCGFRRFGTSPYGVVHCDIDLWIVSGGISGDYELREWRMGLRFRLDMKYRAGKA